MADLSQFFGNDLDRSANGGLLLASGLALSQQRIARRLLTAPGAYWAHPDYGAGLGRFVGSPLNVAQLRGIIVQQILLEDTVASSPIPTVNVTGNPNGTFIVDISYTASDTGLRQALSLPVVGDAR